MMSEKLSRRGFVGGALAAGSVVSLAAIAGCGKKELSCADESALSSDDKNARHLLKYQDKSLEAAKRCNNCVQFQPPPTEGQCGSCKIVKGSINPQGYCISWTAKPG